MHAASLRLGRPGASGLRRARTRYRGSVISDFYHCWRIRSAPKTPACSSATTSSSCTRAGCSGFISQGLRSSTSRRSLRAAAPPRPGALGNVACHHWILGYYDPETQREVGFRISNRGECRPARGQCAADHPRDTLWGPPERLRISDGPQRRSARALYWQAQTVNNALARA